MKVRCLATFPNEEQLEKLGPKFYRDQTFGTTVGKEYLVLGLFFEAESSSIGRGVWVHCVTDYGHPVSVPAVLFEVTDGRASSYWEGRIEANGSLTLWPPSFYREFYHDDLSERVPEVMVDFERVCSELSAEFEEEDASSME